MEFPYSIFLSEAASNPASERRKSARFARAGIGIALILILIACYASGMTGRSETAAMSVGGFVGAIELLGRYRQAPIRAVLSVSGLVYVVVNMGASWSAYYLLGAFAVLEHVTVARDLTQVLTAGFGALVFMRSSFFKIRVGDTDIGIGPAAILDTLLLVADRGVDRREAVARAQEVAELAARVKEPRRVAKMLTKYCLALMQNVDEKTGRDVLDATDKIMSDPDTPDPIKMDIVALRLGIIVGSDVLEAAVVALGDRLTTVATNLDSPSPPPPTVTPASPAPTAAEVKAAIEKASKPGTQGVPKSG